MSRREDRSSESKRRRSRFDREPSPKRSRRDGKPETERSAAQEEPDKDRLDRDHKHRRRLQDPVPLEAPVSHDPKVESGTMGKESENKSEGHRGGRRHSSDPTKAPQSRSYFEHDDRGSAGRDGRSFSRRTENVVWRFICNLDSEKDENICAMISLKPKDYEIFVKTDFLNPYSSQERGWWRDPKEQQNDRAIDKTVPRATQQKDEKGKDSREDNHVWRHDGYFEMEANPKPPARKRPSFREQKIPADPEKTNKASTAPGMPNNQDHTLESGRCDEREHASRHSDKPERPFAGDRELNRAHSWRGNFSSRDRSGTNGRYRGRDRFMPRQSYLPTGGRVEKWKHDLYTEANRSPSPKNDEDQISKIEALLAS
ncbi:UNVERIFIED_CONTAM: hypothetical protein Sradi_2589900 [Sesamum radiatum]|uniref:Btz domain-containing protein n=1 Tax=Sesamum radiatum TaxID=300843 RepID=A0AAW2S3J2_SESRA